MAAEIKLNELASRKARSNHGINGLRTLYTGYDIGTGMSNEDSADGGKLNLVPDGGIYSIVKTVLDIKENIEDTVTFVKNIPEEIKNFYVKKIGELQAAYDRQLARLPADIQNFVKLTAIEGPKTLKAFEQTLRMISKLGGAALRTCGLFLVGGIAVGWILFKIFTLDFSSLWGAFTQGTTALWNFNWNISDKGINEQLNSTWESFGGLLGGTLGNLVGFTACGALPGSALLVINEGLAMTVLKEVGEEAFEEFVGNLRNLSMSLWRATASTTLLWAYKDIRRAVKFPGNKFGEALKGVIGEDKFKKWGKDGGESFSFSSAFENVVEKIPNTFIENFIEEFFEEATESCVEAGFIVTNTIESQLKMTTDAVSPLLGQPTLVEVVFNRRTALPPGTV